MRPVTVAGGLASPEAPVELPDGTWLVVEMADERGCISHVDAVGSVRLVCATGRPNGLALTRSGHVLVAESLRRQLLRVTLSVPEPVIEVLAVADDDGDPFRFPNDLCFGPDGTLYLTDSGLTLAQMREAETLGTDFTELAFDGRLYAIDVTTGRVETVERGLGHANGVSVGPDGGLYVNDTISGDVYRYDLAGGRPSARVTFANVLSDTSATGIRGPDGMAHDVLGNLYVAVFGEGEIVVLDPNGRCVDRLPAGGRQPTNIAIGAGGPAAHVTEREHGRLVRIPARARGAPLHRGPAPADAR